VRRDDARPQIRLAVAQPVRIVGRSLWRLTHGRAARSRFQPVAVNGPHTDNPCLRRLGCRFAACAKDRRGGHFPAPQLENANAKCTVPVWGALKAQGALFMNSQDAAVVLFLDFDGVLHRTSAEVNELFAAVPLLEEVLREFPSVEIVISSSWRVYHGLHEMREFFSEDMAHRIRDATPKHDLARTRQSECQEWLRRHRPAAPWLALDDQPWLFESGCEQLLCVNGTVGFRVADAQRLRERLRYLVRPLSTPSAP
jgi:hypothetical protein